MSKFSDSTFYLAPSGYRETILFPQKPLSSIGHLSVGRASSATRTNPAGQVEQVCYNLLQYSEDFSNAAWSKQSAVITSNSTIAPNGTLTATTLADNTTSDRHRVQQPANCQLGVTYTFSVYVKKVSSGKFLFLNAVAALGVSAALNLDTLEVTNVLGTGAGLSNVGNGWYRFSITGVCVGSNNCYIQMQTSAADLVYVGDGSSFYIWGAQLVQGNLPKDYLYTSDRLNFPRVDYSDGSASFLLEPQRTNLFSNSGWAGGTSIPTNWSSFITGTTTPLVSIKNLSVAAYRFSGTSQRAFFTQTISTTVGVTYSISVYVESVETTQNLDQVMSNYGAGVFYRNGVLISSTAPIEAGYTYTAVFTATTTSVDVRFGLGVQGPNTGNFVMSMPQFEQGAYATSFILTPTASTATRLADTFTRNNIYTNNLISSSGGTWFVELKNNFALVRDNLNESILLGVTNCLGLKTFSGTSRIALIKLIGGSQTTLYTTTNDNTKIVFKWNGTTVDAFVDGVKQVSGSAFAITVMELFNTSIQTPYYIKQMALWNTPLSDSQCVEITS